MATDAIRQGGLEAGQEWLRAHAAPEPAAQASLAAWEVKQFALKVEETEAEAESGVVVRLELGNELDQAAAEAGVRETASALCEALSLPHPRLEIASDAGLPPDGFRLTLDGSTRVAATAGGKRELSPRYRAAASSSIDSDPETMIARSVETALLDDPGLLLPETVAETLASGAFKDSSTEEISVWAAALRRAAAARAPVGEETVRGAVDERALRGMERRGRPGARVQAEPPDSRRSPARHTGRPVLPGSRAGRGPPRIHDHPPQLRAGPPRQPDRSRRTGDDAPRPTVAGSRPGSQTGARNTSAPELAPLLGAEAGGGWTLLVQDLAEGEAGTLVFWSLDIELEGAAAQPSERGQDPADAVQDAMRAERLTFALRPYGLEVRLGSALADALEIREEGADPDEKLLGPLRRLSRDIGLPLLRAVTWRRWTGLGSDQYELVVNDLPRVRGFAPPDLVFHMQTYSGAPSDAPTGFDPKTGAPGVWLPSAEATGPASDGKEPLTAGAFVILEAEACIRRNALDFIDLGATQQHLDGVAAQEPLLVSTLRSRSPTR